MLSKILRSFLAQKQTRKMRFSLITRHCIIMLVILVILCAQVDISNMSVKLNHSVTSEICAGIETANGPEEMHILKAVCS